MEQVETKVDVLAEAQAAIDDCNARIENVRREMQMYRGDKSHLRARISTIEATREEIGRAALARVGGA